MRILDQILTLEFSDYQKGFWDLRFDPTLVYTYMNPQTTVVFSKNGLLAKWYAYISSIIIWYDKESIMFDTDR